MTCFSFTVTLCFVTTTESYIKHPSFFMCFSIIVPFHTEMLDTPLDGHTLGTVNLAIFCIFLFRVLKSATILCLLIKTKIFM